MILFKILLLLHKSPDEASLGIWSWVYDLTSVPWFQTWSSHTFPPCCCGVFCGLYKSGCRLHSRHALACILGPHIFTASPPPHSYSVVPENLPCISELPAESWKTELTIVRNRSNEFMPLSVYYLLTIYFLISVIIFVLKNPINEIHFAIIIWSGFPFETRSLTYSKSRMKTSASLPSC